MDKYDKIIDYEWNGSQKRPKMDLSQRAKIFLPFAALTGYEELLRQVEKDVVEKADGNKK